MSDPVVVAAHEEPTAVARSMRNGAGIVALLVATIVTGTLSPLQSAVNGALGGTVGDGMAAAVESFGTGLLIMIAVVYFCLTYIITRLFNMIERQVPQKR